MTARRIGTSGNGVDFGPVIYRPSKGRYERPGRMVAAGRHHGRRIYRTMERGCHNGYNR